MLTRDELLKSLKPVTLADRPLFDDYLGRYPPVVSELTFTNAYCWAEVRHHLFCEHEGHLLLCYRHKECCLSFYAPVGPEPARLLGERIEGLRDYCWTRLDAGMAAGLGRGARPILDRDNSDYVYRTEDLRTLRGKAYHSKRNFAHRFAELYHPEVRPLTSSDAAECLHIQEQWLEAQRNNETARDESTALTKALHNFEALALSGIGVFVEGVLAAFAIGEPLNPTTFVEHFEKGLPSYTGVYQFLLQAFARSIPESYPFLNREQDLGLEGLRRAKESWHPAQMVEKYTLKVRKQACPSARPPRECEPAEVAADGVL
jgi:hypothetical protein